MNILLLTSEFPPCPGGIGNHAYGLFLGMRKQGSRIRVLTNSRDPLLEQTWMDKQGVGDSVFYISGSFPAWYMYLSRCAKALSLLQELHRGHLNPVLICSGKFSLWLLAILPIRSRVRTLAVVHGSELRRQYLGHWLIQRAFNRADAVVCVSRFTKSKLLESYTIQSKKIRVIHNGYEPPEVALERVQKPGCTLITVGSVSRRKGQFNVVRALPNLARRFPGVIYEVLGLPLEADDLHSEIQRCDVSTRVRVLGTVSEQRKWDHLARAKVFIMLSEELSNGDFEGFGIAILEANHMGLPAIGSRESGIADAIQDGYSGILVDPKSPREIMQALDRILLNYEAFSTQAREHASRYRWDRKIEEYVELLR